MTRVKAVTFDLWDTVIVDDSDEPKRAAQGLPSKPMERRNLVQEYLQRHEPVTRQLVDEAYDKTDAAFREVWYGKNVTWEVEERLLMLLKELERRLPDDELAELVRLHEDMELKVRPDFVPGVKEAIRSLHGKYKLGVISDAIFSPGRTLRELLSGEGVLECFDAFVFSDEIGCSKPAPAVFESAAEQLGVRLEEMVHIGDREQKDVDGAHAVGARAIFCPIAKDRGREKTKADAICDDFGQLLSIVESLDRKR
jgi:HAD superfamily hydrolase (TIGR01549 family)